MNPTRTYISRSPRIVILISLAIIAVFIGLVQAQDKEDPKKDSKYVGVEMCKDCHDQDFTGNQYTKWTQIKHSKTYKVLDSDTALKLGKTLGVDEPKKSDKCLKCHVTAFGQPKEKLGEDFDAKLGVQCESCHGPGSFHLDARAEAAFEAEFEGGSIGSGDSKKYIKLPDGEVDKPTKETCEGCHNKESPSFKEFDYEKQLKEIQHFDPRKER